jgi:2-dehydro-3-deoxygluconokinase
MREVLCLGETMALVAPVDATPLASADLFTLHMGGAESTVALYLAEFGHDVAWASAVGNDPLGRRIVADISAHRVDTSLVRFDDDAPTGVYFKDPDDGVTAVHYYRKGSAASRMSPTSLNGLPLREVPLVHISGITPGLSQSCRAMIGTLFDLCIGSPTRISFDVNYRPGVWTTEHAAPVLLDFARQSDVVFVGRDEAATLWGTADVEAIAELITGSAHRVETLVIKDGGVGATEITPAGATFVPAQPVEIVEVVGAGDAFAAGYLSGLLTGKDAHARLTMGHHLAARALSSTSDFVPVSVDSPHR